MMTGRTMTGRKMPTRVRRGGGFFGSAGSRGGAGGSRAHLLGPIPEGGVVEDDVEVVVARDGVRVGGRAREGYARARRDARDVRAKSEKGDRRRARARSRDDERPARGMRARDARASTMTTTRVCGERPRGTPTARGEATRATTLARFSPRYLSLRLEKRTGSSPADPDSDRSDNPLGTARLLGAASRARTPRRTHARVARRHANPHRCAHHVLSTARVSSRLDPAARDGASIARARMSLGTARAPAAPRLSRAGSRSPSTRSTRLPSNRASPLPPFRHSSRPRARRRERRPRPDRNTLPRAR